jgi:hypothetical protein
MAEDFTPAAGRSTPQVSPGKVCLLAALISVVISAATSALVVFLLRPPGSTHGTDQGAKASPEPAATAAVKPVVEEGKVQAPVQASTKKREVEVSYRTRFASPPQLTFPPNRLDDGCFLVEQKAGSFQLGRDVTGPFGYAVAPWVHWRAEGIPST